MFYSYGRPNLVCILDHKTHSAQKRMIAKLYSKSYLQRSENMAKLSERLISRRLNPVLRGFANDQREVNVVELFEWTSLDSVTAYLFGTTCGTDFLHDKEGRERYLRDWSKKQQSSYTYAEELCMQMCKTVLASQSEGVRINDAEPVVFSTMYTAAAAEAKELQVPDTDVLTRCASEMLDHIIAAQETNTITWTYILYRLSLHPEIQARLRAELLTLQPPSPLAADDRGGELPSPAAIDSLPLLNAVVYETLRLHAANPARMLRVVPASGLELHGYHIPPGTTVSTNAYCLHRNPEAFPQPLEWLPERWLPPPDDPRASSKGGEGASSHSEAMRWCWAFGSGPRMCIGTNFAMQVIKLVIATIYSQYTTSIVDATGIEQTDSYNSGPASHKLTLRFQAVTENAGSHGA
ncbi:hypothetical protein LTR36_010050 [Oleoguttula mirabilis]|uniref:Cytochrome P450 n=1 Tax=Oleoguttula mirabilis TaxID=1507867 RepID=A0AAV9JT20_9PEZI|nr:hypothetical protein LTR36_010050 [Oleoguttula mirabilis]